MVRSHAQHLEALLAEQRLIAAQKPNLQLCWKFLEEEIARVRAAEKVNPTRTTPVKTPSGRHVKKTPEQHGAKKTTPNKTTPDKHVKRATPEHGATKKPAELPEAKTAPVKAPSMLQRVKRAVGADSKVQPIAQKEDALSPVRTPSHRMASPLKQKNTDSAPEVLSPASRLRRKKEKLKAFSTAGAVDEKIQNEYRRKRILQEEAVTSKRELCDMALEERAQKARDFTCVGHDTVFISKAKAYLRLQLFLNARRDYMLVCTRAAQHETYEPVLVSEAELARAVTAYNKGKKPTLSKTGTEAEDWALHYLFKCGRVTIADDKCEILGVDSFSLDDAMKCGNYSDVSCFGAWRAITLEHWQPAGAEGDKIARAFDATFVAAEEDISANERGREEAEAERVKMNAAAKELQAQHAEDAPMLDGLIAGHAPGQKHSAHPVKHHSAGDRPRSRVKPALPKAAHGGH
ncbi:unnamed protein product [Pelagomonas calceolata]|uniref:Uncharacterized protein n=1 Tax=Pelagomonas calceolata TaxID=35677 RepID=A0A8J2SMC2_9STRA|nr:unnamed protein product [Pelagomonas calceolata]